MNNDQNELSEVKMPHLWQPGESGNPSGRPRKTEEEKKLSAEIMSGMRNLGPLALESMKKILDPDNRVQAAARVRMIEVLLSYIVGKPSSEVKLNISAEDMAKDSEIRIAALIQAVRNGGDLSVGYEAISINQEEQDQDEEIRLIEEGNSDVEL